MSKLIQSFTQSEKLNFLLTNRIPRRFLTTLMGKYSAIENRYLTRLSIKIWKLFADDLDLSEAKEPSFKSLQACFIRELKDGLRPIEKDSSVVTSPCDAIIGAFGTINQGRVFQAKGFPYSLQELVHDHELVKPLEGGCYVTLRLKSSMYHRFHAPIDCDVNEVNYISGDTWNVNPIAIKRIEKLYCKNERAVVQLKTKKTDQGLVIVPVAAILVASMKFHCLDETLDLQYKGANKLACSASYQKGDQMGYFQHGSTIILLAPSSYQVCETIKSGERIAMGQALLRLVE
ncbi:MAG: phosphatidylserine decarboxylase [Cycloclasticus sp.]|nr:phosphatidylserine decarboxylase [Cycloclasticus sp.]MBG95655.1 phosphatidylserine decarboxylase [Cycloclasticus sp.]